MKKTFVGVVMVVLLLGMLTGCASLFGNWEDAVPKTLVTTYDEFTGETVLDMKEASGLYANYLPIKLTYDYYDDPTKDTSNLYKLTVTAESILGSSYVTECNILNDKGDRFNVRDLNWNLLGSSSSGYTFINQKEVDQLYNVMNNAEEFVKVRYTSHDIYEMTLPQIEAVKYFIDYVKTNVIAQGK